jgi:hypothetical protein
MFLEELKYWATKELALYELNKENLLEIAHRVRYLESILSRDKLFFSVRWRRRTVQKIILGKTPFHAPSSFFLLNYPSLLFPSRSPTNGV